MDLSHAKLREIQTQEYRPTETTHADSALEDYCGKEFGGAHLAEVFHENTKVNDPMQLRIGPSTNVFVNDPHFQYALGRLQPDYGDRERIELPEPDELTDPIAATVANRRSDRHHAGTGISLEELSTLLQHSCGTTGSQELSTGAESLATKRFRAYPSAGALYPVEVYLAVMNPGENLDRGLYYYVPNDHVLRVLKRDPELPAKTDDLFSGDADEAYDPADSAVTVVLTGTFWRTMAKYGPRGYRYVLQESGHLGQNVLLIAESMGLSAVPLAAFDDRAMDASLGVDGVNEATVYTLSVGVPAAGDRDA